MEEALLSALFVIQYEVESHLGTVRPLWLRRRRSVPDHVARVAGGTAPVPRLAIVWMGRERVLRGHVCYLLLKITPTERRIAARQIVKTPHRMR